LDMTRKAPEGATKVSPWVDPRPGSDAGETGLQTEPRRGWRPAWSTGNRAQAPQVPTLSRRRAPRRESVAAQPGMTPVARARHNTDPVAAPLVPAQLEPPSSRPAAAPPHSLPLSRRRPTDFSRAYVGQTAGTPKRGVFARDSGGSTRLRLDLEIRPVGLLSRAREVRAGGDLLILKRLVLDGRAGARSHAQGHRGPFEQDPAPPACARSWRFDPPFVPSVKARAPLWGLASRLPNAARPSSAGPAYPVRVNAPP
jgi:hypothetical protein